MAALLLGSTAGGCSDDGPTIDVLVVVQETNIPDAPPPCADFAFSYDVTFEIRCDGGETSVTICSDIELCQEQLDEAVKPMASCDRAVRGYETAVGEGC